MTNEIAIKKMKKVLKIFDNINEMLNDLKIKHLKASKK